MSSFKGLNNDVLLIDSIPEMREQAKIRLSLKSINTGRPISVGWFSKDEIEKIIIELQKRLAEL